MSPVPERRKRQAAGPRLSHVDARGRAAMVDVGHKAATAREAWAQGTITMSPAALRAVRTGTVAKGDVLQVARLAGILAAKQTASLIPLCHPLPLSHISVELTRAAAATGSTRACGRRHRPVSRWRR
jgi:cyclic pyranopterin phosphate synthase